jgi:hypothetical protein
LPAIIRFGGNMKASALRIFGTTVLVAATLSACGGSPNSPGAGANDAPGTGVVAVTTATVPTPTATPVRTYTQEELAALVGQLKDAQGHALTVMPAIDLAASLEQTKAALAATTVDPAECSDLALAGIAPSADNAAVAVGSSGDAASGASTAVSMTSGLDEAFLSQIDDMAGQLGKCATMSITAGAVQLSTNLTLLERVGALPSEVAFRTDTKISDGRQQSMITVQAVQRGVLLSVVASGGESEQDAIARAGALLDSAAALIE